MPIRLDLRRHYNRSLVIFDTVTRKLQADAAFEGYLKAELATIKTEITFGAGGSEFNLRSGFKPWTGSPVQTGNPFSRGFFFPCSWGSALTPGEHGYGEPVGTGTAEKEPRFAAARADCRNQLVTVIRSWWAAYGKLFLFGR